jgi:hypothetical protein
MFWSFGFVSCFGIRICGGRLEQKRIFNIVSVGPVRPWELCNLFMRRNTSQPACHTNLSLLVDQNIAEKFDTISNIV